MDEPASYPVPALRGVLDAHLPDAAAATGIDEGGARRRSHTASSAAGASDRADTCRICRSEGTDEEPLFHPCRCAGSIKFVHQDCLMEWLSHSHKKHCELCKTPLRFTKLYDAHMPERLPWAVFVRRACVHVTMMLGKGLRGAVVAAVWLAVLPWLVRWAWRWMFWIADAGWAREAFVSKLKAMSLGSALMSPNETSLPLSRASAAAINATTPADASPPGPALYTFTMDVVLKNFGLRHRTSGSISHGANASTLAIDPSPLAEALQSAHADTSLLSSWTYLADLTPSRWLNRIILDIFEGQLITCVVITGFILVFLIREWVVQQQPLINLENLPNAQVQLREAAERVQADDERLRRQQELLDQARRRLTELETHVRGEARPYIGWDELEKLMDQATAHLREEGGRREFAKCAIMVSEQYRAAVHTDSDFAELKEKLSAKVLALPLPERRAWQGVFRFEALNPDAKKQLLDSFSAPWEPDSPSGSEDVEQDDGTTRRPPTPDRDLSLRATQIQRLLEEAEGILNAPDPIPANPGIAASSNDGSTSSVGTPPSSSGSWQDIGSVPAERSGTADQERYSPDEPSEIPITNAGPDAKVNIKRTGRSKGRPIPAPQEITEADFRKRVEEDEAMKKLEDEIKAEDLATAAHSAEVFDGELPPSDDSRAAGGVRLELNTHVVHSPSTDRASNNPFHPDGPEPEERREEETLGSRVASVFREEFGLDEAEELDNLRQAGLRADNDAGAQDGHPDQQHQRAPNGLPGYLQKVSDWFWGDLEVQSAPELAPPTDEERVADGEQEAPVADATLELPPSEGEDSDLGPAQPVPDHIDVNRAQQAAYTFANPPGAQPPERDHRAENQHDHDPEVLAAAQAAGLDAEAIEDAEDLEGIYELIGFQGPLVGLFQTSTFCTVLVTGTVFGAVGLPYIWGKLVLSFVGSPLYFLVQMPLQIAGFIADVVIDTTLFAGGWVFFVAALGLDSVLAAAGHYIHSLSQLTRVGWLFDLAATTATRAGGRLQNLFLTQAPIENDLLGWTWAFLGASTHAHASLRFLQDECNAVLHWTGHSITSIADAVSTGSASAIYNDISGGVMRIPSLFPDLLKVVPTTLSPLVEPLLRSFGVFKSTGGSLSFEVPTVVVDPSLIFWSSTDRFLAVAAGYISLAAVATFYVAVDRSISHSDSGQKTEEIIRDTLRQAGGVLKVILIISIEMLAFPFYCGLLLDLAFLPLFQGATVASRWQFAVARPYLFCFIHWFLGTCYMFHFALFVGMCRRILRKGVLWFIRDPDDPTFHPVRDVLERNVTTQLRKIAFSALVYGALVILCLGGVIWSIGQCFEGTFPIHWISTEPTLEFPMDLLLFNGITPLVIRLFKPSDTINTMYAWWLRRCARVLRLSHFLFDDRQKDEEGRLVRKSWEGFSLIQTVVHLEAASAVTADARPILNEDQPDVYWKPDGKYVLTPCNDQYRPPKPGEAFLHYADPSPADPSDKGDVYIINKDGERSAHFAKVYIPPHFRVRIALFMVGLWMFSAATGLCATLVPLCFGRHFFSMLVPQGVRVNDIYAYSAGAYILAGLLLILLQGRAVAEAAKDKAIGADIKAWAAPIKRVTIRALKCTYVYGFIGVVLPMLFALILQFYVILPLHTYTASRTGTSATNSAPSSIFSASASNANSTQSLFQQAASQTEVPTLAQHTIHILQDYCLGLLYLRLAARLVLTAPASRAAEVFRRITNDGYFNPNMRLATRFLILPVTFLSAFALLFPPSICLLITTAAELLSSSGDGVGSFSPDTEAQIKIFRYSYPLAAALLAVFLCAEGIDRAVQSWRARVKDEVYLVGERLHNYGEKRPPVRSRGVVRTD